MLVTWEPFDFGLRRANVAVANALEAESEAALKRTEYEVAVATADACLTLAAAEETIRAAQAGVDRAGVLVRTITAQVNAQLRPGADASRADAELAAARTQWIQAQQAADVARATLSQFVGMEPGQVVLDAAGLVQIAPGAGRCERSIRRRIRSRRNRMPRWRRRWPGCGRWNAPIFHASICRARRMYADRARRSTGAILGGLNGLAPNTQNYALGFTVTFPIADLPAIRAREAAQTATVRAQTGPRPRRSRPTCGRNGIAR